MNTIFLKEVSHSVLKGKFIKLDYVDIGCEDYIIEINISNKITSMIVKDSLKIKSSLVSKYKSNSWINNLYTKYTLIRFKRDITKIINISNLIGYTIVYSNTIKKNKVVKEYLEMIFNLLSINEYINTSSVQENLNKYIEEYIDKNSINKESINPLIIVNDTTNLNLDLINSLNKKYKEVNIYTGIKPTKQFLNKIKNINDEYGSCISVLTKLEKDLRKYNIYIFVDNPRGEYTRCKFNKKACFIDFTNKESDRFNQKYIMLENGIRNNKFNGIKIKELYELYGKITVSTVIVD